MIILGNGLNQHKQFVDDEDTNDMLNYFVDAVNNHVIVYFLPLYNGYCIFKSHEEFYIDKAHHKKGIYADGYYIWDSINKKVFVYDNDGGFLEKF